MDKGYLNDLKIHGITLLITIVAEYIGLKKFDLGFGAIVLFPLIYSLIFGGIISLPKMKLLDNKEMSIAAQILGASFILMIAKLDSRHADQQVSRGDERAEQVNLLPDE